MPRWLRGLVVLVLCLAVLGAAVVGGFGWYYSNQLLNVSHEGGAYDVTVQSTGRGTVTFERSADTARPGVYGITWHGGSAIVGAITAQSESTITRRLTGERPAPRTRVRLDDDVWNADPGTARRLTFQDITVSAPLGPLPSWLIAGKKRTWVVAVHGRGGDRGQALRILPTLHRLGLPVLDITYRNDPGAPREGDRLYHLGDTEWRDVEAAVRYAVRRGAQRVVLYGWSMGGALISAFLVRSPAARRVRAIVLDAPVLDWRATLDLQARNRGVPVAGVLTPVAEQVVAWRIGIDWDDFDVDDHPSTITKPTLVFHGEDDRSVPIDPARRLAERSAKVSLVAVPHADHTGAWNVAPRAYEQRVADFLRPLTAEAPRRTPGAVSGRRSGGRATPPPRAHAAVRAGPERGAPGR